MRAPAAGRRVVRDLRDEHVHHPVERVLLVTDVVVEGRRRGSEPLLHRLLHRAHRAPVRAGERVATGSIIFRATLVPQLFGVLFVAARLGWALFLIPPIARIVQGPLFAFGGLTEIALMLWLVVRGQG